MIIVSVKAPAPPTMCLCEVAWEATYQVATPEHQAVIDTTALQVTTPEQRAVIDIVVLQATTPEQRAVSDIKLVMEYQVASEAKTVPRHTEL